MNKPHVLVIEDDVSVCELLFSCLSKADYRVSVAQSGEAGLQQIEEDPPEVIVLDLNLPGMNGLDVCRTMRRDPWMSKLPVLMLTGEAEEEDIVAGLEVGADDYMTKPFSPKLLTARVMALLRRGKQIDTTDDSKGDSVEILSIKTLGQCGLVLAGRRLSWTEEFSPSQRQLMALLVGAPGGKVSQEEVQVALWPESSASRARSSFDSLLSRVRRTMDATLDPFDSKRYLVVKRGYLCLENCRIDAHEFKRLIRKAGQQISAQEFWPAEITFSSAFSLWQGPFVPGDFGCELTMSFQGELERLCLEASQTFARLLADSGRFQQAVKILRDALRYDPANDEIIRLLYQLYLAQEHPRQASQILKQYAEVLTQEKFSEKEIREALKDFPQEVPTGGWLKG